MFSANQVFKIYHLPFTILHLPLKNLPFTILHQKIYAAGSCNKSIKLKVELSILFTTRSIIELSKL